jgi:hypothetical protein
VRATPGIVLSRDNDDASHGQIPPRSNADLRPDIIATSQREQIARMRVLFEI